MLNTRLSFTRREDQGLQETGAEVGDSIFNLTGKNRHGSKSFEVLLCQFNLLWHVSHCTSLSCSVLFSEAVLVA